MTWTLTSAISGALPIDALERADVTPIGTFSLAVVVSTVQAAGRGTDVAVAAGVMVAAGVDGVRGTLIKVQVIKFPGVALIATDEVATLATAEAAGKQVIDCTFQPAGST